MNTTQLKARLISEGFKENVYGIDGSLPAFEGLVLEKQGARWKIDHFERGIRRELVSFASESEACDRLYELTIASHRGGTKVETSQLVGRQVHLRVVGLSEVTVAAVIRAVDPETSSLLLEFVAPIQIGARTYPFALARPRLERDNLRTLLDSGALGCGIVCVPRERHDPARPFDVNWWRGGGAAIGDVVLDDL